MLKENRYVPKKFKDLNLCLEAVKNTGMALEYVPEELKDLRMCLTAVKQNEYVLDIVPEKYKAIIKKELNL